MRQQNTLKKEVIIKGVGLHTGRVINVRLKPAPRDTGICFIRADRGYAEIEAAVCNVFDTTFATNLVSKGVRVGTVEHILSAFAGLSIDNAYVELDGPEVPIMDGSAYYFTQKIIEAGIAKQARSVSCLRILSPVVIEEGLCQIAILPYEGMKITYCVDYNHPSFREQKLSLDITQPNFIKEIAPARTFGFLRDVKMLKSKGLAKGGSLENAIVVGENGVINKGELRFKDEFVRHKILDAVGDFSLLGKPVYGHIIAHRAGHSLNVKLIKKILSYTDLWEVVSSSAPLRAMQEPSLTAQI